MAETTENKNPAWIDNSAKGSIKSIKDWINSDNNYIYGSKKGESLFTGLNGMQNNAIGNAQWLANQDISKMFGIDKAASGWDQYADAGAQTFNLPEFGYSVTEGTDRAAPSLQTTTSVNESGPLGSFSSYMSPFISGVLDPQIREIQKESDRQRNQIGAQAAMAGAFGDARHGIMEGQNFQKTNQQISDATGQAYAGAFDRAMSARQADIGRFDEMARADANLTEAAQQRKLQGDIQTGQFSQAGAQMNLDEALANQRAREAAIERTGTAAKAAEALGSNYFDKWTAVNDQLFNAGNIAQQNQEKQRATIQQFQEALSSKDYNSAVKLLQALNGSPHSTTQTTSSNDGLWGILGSVIGGML